VVELIAAKGEKSLIKKTWFGEKNNSFKELENFEATQMKRIHNKGEHKDKKIE